MELTNVKKVGIIGAGVSGLSTAKLLKAQGIHCKVFESNSVLGGVWAVGYSNFGVQVQRELYEFPDWPLPKGVPDFTPGPVIQKYLEDYAKHFGVWPNIMFNTSVVDMQQRAGAEHGWVVTYDEAGVQGQDDFDLVVVCTGLFSKTPNMPEFPYQDRFKGTIIHVSELTTRDKLAGKKVAVVGFGKSATDAAVESAAVASQTKIIFREPHWPVPRKLLGVLPFKWAMLSRLTSALIPLYYHPSGLERALHTLGKPLVWFWRRLVELLLILQCGLWSRFGTRPSLVPKKPVEIDTFGESVMLPRPEFYKLVRKNVIIPQQTEIAEYTPTGIILKNGQNVSADVVVLATGWKTDYGFLPGEVARRIKFEADGVYLYRHMFHPDVPNLFFVGCASTIASILTYNLQARWLTDLIAGNHRLPDREYILRDIEDMKAWKRKWMPFSPGRGSRLLLHMLHYHDELLNDFGATRLRKTGILAPFKEVFAPYQPNDYGVIVSGESANHHAVSVQC
jgi:dimethylaniline monooxygenase (N-oxide forming)